MAVGDRVGPIGLWRIGDGMQKKIGEITPVNALTGLSFNHDGKTLVTTDNSRSTVLWNVQEYAAPQPGPAQDAHSDVLVATQQSRDGRSMTTVSADGTAAAWDLTDRNEPVRRTTAKVHGGVSLTSALISNDGRTLISTAWDRKVAVTDLTDPAKPKQLSTFEPGLDMFTVQALSPDGRTLILGGSGERQVWDLTNRSAPAKLRIWYTAFTGEGPVTFSPDGRTVAEADGTATVHLVDVTTIQNTAYLSFLEGHREQIEKLVFSPDGKTLVTTSRDGAAILWDISDLRRPHKYTKLAITNSHTSLAFSSDGKTLALGGREAEVQVWDIAQPARPVLLSRLMLGAQQAPDGMAFSPDGTFLTIPSERSSRFVRASYVTKWDLRELNSMRADPSKYGCTIAGRGLTEEEWKRQIPELPYVRTCG